MTSYQHYNSTVRQKKKAKFHALSDCITTQASRYFQLVFVDACYCFLRKKEAFQFSELDILESSLFDQWRMMLGKLSQMASGKSRLSADKL